MKIKGDSTLKWMLRFNYLVLFIVGIACTSVGIFSFFENDDSSNLKDFTIFIGVTATIIGIAIIIIAFYRKKQSEDYINKKRL